jgi:hypothetical protein
LLVGEWSQDEYSAQSENEDPGRALVFTTQSLTQKFKVEQSKNHSHSYKISMKYIESDKIEIALLQGKHTDKYTQLYLQNDIQVDLKKTHSSYRQTLYGQKILVVNYEKLHETKR